MAYLLIIPITLFILFIAKKILKILYIPSFIAMMFIGIYFGPSGINFIDIFLDFIGQPEKFQIINNTITTISLLGLIFMMVRAGMESSFNILKIDKKRVFSLVIISSILPLIAAFFIGLRIKLGIPGIILLISIFISHSMTVIINGIRNQRLENTAFGVLIAESSEVMNFISILLLLAALNFQQYGGNSLLENNISLFRNLYMLNNPVLILVLLILTIAIYLIAAFFLVPPFLKGALKKFNKIKLNSPLVFILILLIFTYTSELLGLSIVGGAATAGIVISMIIPENELAGIKDLFYRLGYGLFLPFLFFTIGAETRFQPFLQINNLLLLLFIFAGIILSKFISGLLSVKINGVSDIKSLCGGLIYVPQLSITLFLALLGKMSGIIGTEIYTSIVITVIITSVAIPLVLKYIIDKNKLKFDFLKYDFLKYDYQKFSILNSESWKLNSYEDGKRIIKIDEDSVI